MLYPACAAQRGGQDKASGEESCQGSSPPDRASRRAQRRGQLERARVERSRLDARELALLSDERLLERAPPGSREHALPAEGHAAEPLLLALQQTMHELEDREDITAMGEDAERAGERPTARSGGGTDPLLQGA